MAASVVSGMAALALETAYTLGLDLPARPTRAYILKQLLIETAVPIPGQPTEAQGAGLVSWPHLYGRLQDIAAGRDSLDNYEPVV